MWGRASPPSPCPHQSLGDIPSCGQRFEMSAVINQLHLFQVQGLQNLLTGSVHHLQLFMAVHPDQRAAVNPLRRESAIFSLCSTPVCVSSVSEASELWIWWFSSTAFIRTRSLVRWDWSHTFPKSQVRPIIAGLVRSRLRSFLRKVEKWIENSLSGVKGTVTPVNDRNEQTGTCYVEGPIPLLSLPQVYQAKHLAVQPPRCKTRSLLTATGWPPK